MTNEEFIESIRLEGEEWRKVIGEYDHNYVVSSYGRVASLWNAKTDKNGIIHRRKPRLFNLHKNSFGYLVTSFIKDGHPVMVKAHRLVAEAFIPNPSGYKEIDHIDADKSNNHKNNLRWCNRSINMSNPITAKANGVRKSKPILRIDEQGNTKRYDSISSVVADGFPRTTITYYCDKSNKRYKGFLWKRL